MEEKGEEIVYFPKEKVELYIENTRKMWNRDKYPPLNKEKDVKILKEFLLNLPNDGDSVPEHICVINENWSGEGVHHNLLEYTKIDFYEYFRDISKNDLINLMKWGFFLRLTIAKWDNDTETKIAFRTTNFLEYLIASSIKYGIEESIDLLIDYMLSFNHSKTPLLHTQTKHLITWNYILSDDLLLKMDEIKDESMIICLINQIDPKELNMNIYDLETLLKNSIYSEEERKEQNNWNYEEKYVKRNILFDDMNEMLPIEKIKKRPAFLILKHLFLSQKTGYGSILSFKDPQGYKQGNENDAKEVLCDLSKLELSHPRHFDLLYNTIFNWRLHWSIVKIFVIMNKKPENGLSPLPMDIWKVIVKIVYREEYQNLLDYSKDYTKSPQRRFKSDKWQEENNPNNKKQKIQ